MDLKLAASIHFYYPSNMPRKFTWSTMSSKNWHIAIIVKFNKQKDSTTTEFLVSPPLTTPNKLRKELSFKTTSYKELHKWLKKNQNRIGKFESLKV